MKNTVRIKHSYCYCFIQYPLYASGLCQTPDMQLIVYSGKKKTLTDRKQTQEVNFW